MKLKSEITEAFKLKKSLGLDDTYIMHPLRNGMFILRQKWTYSDKDLFAESNGYTFDMYAVWVELDDLVERLNVQQNLQSRACS
jgi:hypothetical protein